MSVDSKIISANGFSGNISLSKENGIHIKLHLTAENPIQSTDVIKLNLTSSHHKLPPFNCGTAEGNGKDFRLTKNIDIPYPYSNEEIDTAEIILKNVFTEDCEVIARISFAEDYPDMDAIREKLSLLQGNEAYKAYLDMEELPSPIDTAEETLEGLYEILSPANYDGANNVYMDYIREFAESNEKIDLNIDGYSWHRCLSSAPPVNASSVEHIFSTPDIVKSIKRYGYWILGIKYDDNTICIAIPTDKDAPNPIPHIDDCTVYLPSGNENTEYCTVCISFEPDGQYFMGIC